MKTLEIKNVSLKKNSGVSQNASQISMFLEGLETLAIPIWVYKCWLLCIDMRVFLLFYFSQKEAYHTLNIFLSLIGDLSRVQVHEQQLSEVWEKLWEFGPRIL